MTLQWHGVARYRLWRTCCWQLSGRRGSHTQRAEASRCESHLAKRKLHPNPHPASFSAWLAYFAASAKRRCAGVCLRATTDDDSICGPRGQNEELGLLGELGFTSDSVFKF